mmetsp:Transcript_62459/g.118054  ORF Transcript_62459/g.118054 Transcript_62459/m.118054 type:complete len:90 (-) Transcript_62459:1017-1286(-)
MPGLCACDPAEVGREERGGPTGGPATPPMTRWWTIDVPMPRPPTPSTLLICVVLPPTGKFTLPASPVCLGDWAEGPMGQRTGDNIDALC